MISRTPSVAFESCVDSVASAINSAQGGASRVELCASLDIGGTTPSHGMIAECVERSGLPVFVIIRPRGGGFTFDEHEISVMERDISAARSLGAQGIVVGALLPDATVDVKTVRRLLERARPLPVTFHRAFDAALNPMDALATLVELGVDRVLTSGGAPTALEGAAAIGALVRAAGPHLSIIAGGGVRPHNVTQLMQLTGVREVHARLATPASPAATLTAPALGAMGAHQETTVEAVHAMVQALHA